MNPILWQLSRSILIVIEMKHKKSYKTTLKTNLFFPLQVYFLYFSILKVNVKKFIGDIIISKISKGRK